MQHLTFVFEDTLVVGMRTQPETTDGKWQLLIVDVRTGQEWAVSWRDHELTAVLAVALQGDDASAANWKVAEAATQGLPKEARIIP